MRRQKAIQEIGIGLLVLSAAPAFKAAGELSEQRDAETAESTVVEEVDPEGL